MTKRLVLAALATLIALPAAAQSPTGTFVSQSGDTRVRFADCGGQICGTIVAARGATPTRRTRTRPCATAPSSASA